MLVVPAKRLLALLSIVCLAACAAEGDAEFQLVPILSDGLSQPVFLTHAGDDLLYLVERRGTIRLIERGILERTPFLDIRDRVGSDSKEQGLLSVAFHSGYQRQGHPGYGRFFVNYTDRAGDTVIAQFQRTQDDKASADAGSEIILLKISQPYGNHNGGQVAFGPDGFLYIGMGDGGSAGDPGGNGQNPRTLLGSILRLDVDRVGGSLRYAVPETNPFVNNEDAKEEVWSYGLRNPWRFSFDRLTGDLFIADVGQDEWEELNFQPAGSGGGENYGWNIVEGNHCYGGITCNKSGLIAPIFEYAHRDGACSITGGYVYRGNLMPEFQGNYFLADYCSGQIWRLGQSENGEWSELGSMLAGFQVSSFGEDSDGELYLLDFSGGRVLQLRQRSNSG